MENEFKFKRKELPHKFKITVHMHEELYNRFRKACSQLNIPKNLKRGWNPFFDQEQELIRQMIDHCLKEMKI